MPKPRESLVSLEATPFYDCISGCAVRSVSPPVQQNACRKMDTSPFLKVSLTLSVRGEK